MDSRRLGNTIAITVLGLLSGGCLEESAAGANGADSPPLQTASGAEPIAGQSEPGLRLDIEVGDSGHSTPQPTGASAAEPIAGQSEPGLRLDIEVADSGHSTPQPAGASAAVVDRAVAIRPVFDTLAVVGGVDETNPLFTYRQPLFAQLVSDSVVVYSDESSARMVVANLLSGEGWEVSSPRGRAGPGEFDGETPFVTSFGGAIHAIQVMRLVHHSWSSDGTLIGSRTFERTVPLATGLGLPVGVLTDRVLARWYLTQPDPSLTGEQQLPQWIELLDVTNQSALNIGRAMLPWIGEVRHNSDGTRNASSRPGAASLHRVARGGLLAWLTAGDNTLYVADPTGSIVATREFVYRLSTVHIDADERIWLVVEDDDGTRLNIVLDGRLVEQFRVTGPIPGFLDARGDLVLAAKRGAFSERALVLIRFQNPPQAMQTGTRR